MVDHLDPEARSRNMRNIRSVDTRAELVVRQVAHALGYRYRLHRRDLPGKPDLVFPSRRLILFVNGCFWHRHAGCKRSTIPKSNVSFWQGKFSRTVTRDLCVAVALKELGWHVSTIWECETQHREELEALLRKYLGPAVAGRKSRGRKSLADQCPPDKVA
jgi:DNA mismatch endonuclease (patch repair protein)